MMMIWGICCHDIDARNDSLQDKQKRAHAEKSKGLTDADMKLDTMVKRMLGLICQLKDEKQILLLIVKSHTDMIKIGSQSDRQTGSQKQCQ